MIRCRSCLIPDTRPDTHFDASGQCSACSNFAARPSIDWSARKSELEAILDRSDKNGSGFDCIVPSSGGKDSTYQVMQLISMGARPLVVTASTCYLTPIGRANIDNLARHATTIEFTPNRAVRAKLNLFGLETVGDISYPEHMAIFSIPFQAAAKFGIPLIFYGECPQREYSGPPGSEEAKTMTRRWVHEFGGLLGLRADDCVGYEGITADDMMDYRLPGEMMGTTAYFLGQFIPWDSHRNALLARQAGMLQKLPSTTSWWAHENLDNAMTGIHDHQGYRKYGYGRAAAQLSVDIRHGLISRDEAMKKVEEIDGLPPLHYADVLIDDVLGHLGISLGRFNDALDKFTNWDLFSKIDGGRPILKEFTRQAA